MLTGFRQHAVKSNYQVFLPQFEGPLDLLLHLVDDEKLPLSEISLALVARQYQEYLQALEQLDVEIESSYIVVFSQLLELKSKLLLPPQPAPIDLYEDEFCPVMLDEGEVHDAPEQLLDQLQAYRLVKEATDWLYRCETRSMAQYSRPVGMHEVDCPELDVSLEALSATWLRMDRKYQVPRNPVELKRIVLSVPDRVKQLWELLRRQPRTFFREVLKGDINRALVIVTFLAVLELVRRHRLSASQASLEDEIVLSPQEGTQTLTAPETSEEYR